MSNRYLTMRKRNKMSYLPGPIVTPFTVWSPTPKGNTSLITGVKLIPVADIFLLALTWIWNSLRIMIRKLYVILIIMEYKALHHCILTCTRPHNCIGGTKYCNHSTKTSNTLHSMSIEIQHSASSVNLQSKITAITVKIFLKGEDFSCVNYRSTFTRL